MATRLSLRMVLAYCTIRGGGRITATKPQINRAPAGLFETVEAEIKLRGYSPKTAKAYLGALRGLWPISSQLDDIRHYLLNLIEGKQLSPSTVNRTISALRFLYIQELLGHKRLETTRVYTHVANPARLKIKSPF